MATTTRYAVHRARHLLEQVVFTRMAPSRLVEAIAREGITLHPERLELHAHLARATVKPLTPAERSRLRGRLLQHCF